MIDDRGNIVVASLWKGGHLTGVRLSGDDLAVKPMQNDADLRFGIFGRNDRIPSQGRKGARNPGTTGTVTG